jgi:23S rRNA pseudouridine2605 synthase
MTRKPTPPGNNTVRLQVYMAHCGIGSRRKCEEYIRERKVMVNGSIVDTPGYKVSPGDTVLFEGEEIVPEKKKIYIVLHKPVDYLCSHSDPYHRPLAEDLFQHKIKERLFHVGRLDYRSSGLIFFTNDGDFAYRVIHPSFEIEKEYIVKTGKKIPVSVLEEYRRGLKRENIVYSLKDYSLLSPYKVKLTLVEGKNREIRRVFHFFNIPVKRIHRIRIGIVQCGSLLPGQFRYLSRKEVEWFSQ